MQYTVPSILSELRAQKNPRNVAGMARFGITTENTLGIAIPTLRTMAKRIGKDHALSLQLWKSGIHEARILAAFVDDPEEVTPRQMDAWIKAFDSWDVCDQVCANLFDRTPYAFAKAKAWAREKGEYQRRAGFALMAALAWHDKKASDAQFLPFLPIIERYAADERNYVKKAVNWALRQIGKRSSGLRSKAIAVSRRMATSPAKSAQWIARDALRELEKRAG